MKPAQRTWELLWQGEWTRIIGMDATAIVLASGHGVAWETQFGSGRPRGGLRTRYTVPVRDPEGSLVPMAWRPGQSDLVLLAQDLAGEEVAQTIRRRLSEPA